MQQQRYEFHALANLFPLIEGTEFGGLVDDIRANGLRDEIWLFEGKILDGRNRYRACTTAGGQVPSWMFKQFDPAQHGDPLAFVLSKNLHRRHLNESQRAMVAARIANMRQGEKRGDAKPAQAGTPEGLFTDETKPANLPVSQVGQADAATSLNVSERLVRSAKKVQAQGSLELQNAVEQGKLAVSAAAQAADQSPEVQAEVVRLAQEGKVNPARTAIKRGAREAKEAALGAKQLALPDQKFGVIYADDEWRFEPYSRETGMDRAPDNHYPTSTLEEIKARDVASIAADDCALFMWATAPMIREALEVMAHRGFTYKTQWIWNKLRPGDGRGPGYWNTNEHEILLLGTRGNIPAPAPGTQWPSVVSAWVGEHSEKPDVFAQMIERYFPNLPKIELNARRARPGWTVWGLEAPDAEPVTTKVVTGSALTQEMQDRIKALTDENGLVRIDPTHAVAAEFVTFEEIAEAERYQAEKRTQTLAAAKELAGDRGPRWQDQLLTAEKARAALTAPMELAVPASGAGVAVAEFEAAMDRAKAKAPEMEIPAFLLRIKSGAA